jgi:hypothetical protein
MVFKIHYLLDMQLKVLNPKYRVGILLTLWLALLFIFVTILHKKYTVKIKNYTQFFVMKFKNRPIDADKIVFTDILKPSISICCTNYKTQTHDGLPIFSTLRINKTMNHENNYNVINYAF